ncbi:ScbA/BarX family gamma-butyrolactone biosynthesis protein [Streptomyces sp. NPDC005551]|uniref:ScbA/BarX family gamma-butyrolactone biosynthesis protein n=1 Tax=Streptomyces sp. NPDC005551 TaxID=3364725 RepID=UPI0036B73854
MTLLTLHPAHDSTAPNGRSTPEVPLIPAMSTGPLTPHATSAGLVAAGGLTTTVPREYVHRASHAEVFLTGCRRRDDANYALTGQWPRAHTFFTTPDGAHHDALQAAETIRQTGLYLAHAELGVPLGHHFLLHDLTVTTHPEQMSIGSLPTDLTLHATCTDVVRKGIRLAEFRMQITITGDDGRPYAAGGGRFTCLTPATYRRLRAAGISGDPLPPAADPFGRPHPDVLALPGVVGKLHPFDVVLSPTGDAHRWLLNPDPCHPVLFDHGGDHYPGMVLVEAARQATHAHHVPANPLTTTLVTEFHNYAELRAPLLIETTLQPGPVEAPAVRVTGRQNDRAVFTTDVITLTTP